jgi:hypothetical protein
MAGGGHGGVSGRAVSTRCLSRCAALIWQAVQIHLGGSCLAAHLLWTASLPVAGLRLARMRWHASSLVEHHGACGASAASQRQRLDGGRRPPQKAAQMLPMGAPVLTWDKTWQCACCS